MSTFEEYERLTIIHGEEKHGDGDLVAAKEEFEAVMASFQKTRDEIVKEDRGASECPTP